MLSINVLAADFLNNLNHSSFSRSVRANKMSVFVSSGCVVRFCDDPDDGRLTGDCDSLEDEGEDDNPPPPPTPGGAVADLELLLVSFTPFKHSVYFLLQ